MEHGTWIYPSSQGVLEKAGLDTIEAYIRKRRMTVPPFARRNKIFQDCCESAPMARNCSQNIWWDVVQKDEREENQKLWQRMIQQQDRERNFRRQQEQETWNRRQQEIWNRMVQQQQRETDFNQNRQQDVEINNNTIGQ